MSNNIASGLHDIRRAVMKFAEAEISAKKPKSKELIRVYLKRLEWIIMDFKTNTNWSDDLREALRKDLSSDSLTTEAIISKIDYLSPEDREEIEELIDIKVRLRKQAAEAVKRGLIENK